MQEGQRFIFWISAFKDKIPPTSDIWEREDWDGNVVEICNVFDNRVSLRSISPFGYRGMWWLTTEHAEMLIKGATKVKWRD